MKRLLAAALSTLCFLLTAACGGQPATGATPAPPAATVPSQPPLPADPRLALLEQALRADSFDGAIAYDALARTPDDLSGTAVLLTGTIVQIMPGDGFTAYRFAVEGDTEQMLYVESYPDYPADTLLEGDYAALYGVAYGTYTYKTVLGAAVTLPAMLAARLEKAEMPMPALPEYPAGPLTLERRYSSGKVWATIDLESFTITNAEKSYSGELKITCALIGTVTGSDMLSIDLKCYDAEGFLLDSGSLYGSVSDGERFKITDTAYIPADTTRIELAAG